jgi:hypothetical protein
LRGMPNGEFGTPPAGPRKIEANLRRRTRLIVEVWIEMNTFGQLCQSFETLCLREGCPGSLHGWYVLDFVLLLPVSSTRYGRLSIINRLGARADTWMWIVL